MVLDIYYYECLSDSELVTALSALQALLIYNQFFLLLCLGVVIDTGVGRGEPGHVPPSQKKNSWKIFPSDFYMYLLYLKRKIFEKIVARNLQKLQ